MLWGNGGGRGRDDVEVRPGVMTGKICCGAVRICSGRLCRAGSGRLDNRPPHVHSVGQNTRGAAISSGRMQKSRSWEAPDVVLAA